MSSASVKVLGYGMLELLEEGLWTGWFDLAPGSIQVDVVGSQERPDDASMMVLYRILGRVNQFATSSVDHLKRKSMHREKLRMRNDLRLVRICFDTWEDYDFTMYFITDLDEERPYGVIFKDEKIISG
jgi:hypothetical protein